MVQMARKRKQQKPKPTKIKVIIGLEEVGEKPSRDGLGWSHA